MKTLRKYEDEQSLGQSANEAKGKAEQVGDSKLCIVGNVSVRPNTKKLGAINVIVPIGTEVKIFEAEKDTRPGLKEREKGRTYLKNDFLYVTSDTKEHLIHINKAAYITQDDLENIRIDGMVDIRAKKMLKKKRLESAGFLIQGDNIVGRK